MRSSDADPAAAAEFAGPDRVHPDLIGQQRQAFIGNPLAVTMLDSMPGPAVVLNSRRQIVVPNRQFLAVVGVGDESAVLARRPGEVLDCVHATERPGGCGMSEHCSRCGALIAVLAAWRGRSEAEGECRVCTRSDVDGGALDFRVRTSFLAVDGQDFVVLTLQDISAEKRRHVLERVFFHDVLNVCGGIHGLAELLLTEGLGPEVEQAFKRDVYRLSSAVIDEIMAHRQMLAAEQGVLKLDLQDVSSDDALDEVVAFYRHHGVADGRTLVRAAGDPLWLRTDPMLLRRVLGNLVKNALEATPRGGTVTVAAAAEDDGVRFTVHNPGVMPEAVRLQLFQRSFSTKGGEGRGVGTYSVRLFSERFLGGNVSFTSDEPGGTTFTVTVPLGGPASELAA